MLELEVECRKIEAVPGTTKADHIDLGLMAGVVGATVTYTFVVNRPHKFIVGDLYDIRISKHVE